jgi:methylenetetrahydrofolate reductase (NADPH)
VEKKVYKYIYSFAEFAVVEMVKIIEKLRDTLIEPYFSFEFFPPKTEAGVENLYLRMDRMTSLQPLFVDVTWGAGGSTKELTMAICEYSQTYFGVDALMHLTCTNLAVDEIKRILKTARDMGIQNILALRGDPAKGSISWEPYPGGCDNAIDLVKLIRKEHGDYFCIGVAGFPEGHPYSTGDSERDMHHLKSKIEAGADFILSQFFYDSSVFLQFRERCLSEGITCPIIPGMMPLQSYSSFYRMTKFCKTKVPDQIWTDLEPIRDDDEQVKAYGVKLCTDMCNSLREHGIKGFHFYTLNLEQSVTMVLNNLGVQESLPLRRTFPWRGSRSNLNGMAEEVRPINWANRPKSYIKRTVHWDEFPNGRWGDNRSPAYGDLSDSHFFRPVEGKKEDLRAIWGEAPILPSDVYEIFALYIEGKIPIIPWCESALQAETGAIANPLSRINRAGFLTINSQPAVNGERSDHPVFGWGGPAGRVYQKAYTEFFCSPHHLHKIMELIGNHPSLTFYAVDAQGLEHHSACAKKGVMALTWGCFPNKEILQPTVFDYDSFLVWSKEVFQLWTRSWASLYEDDSESADLLYNIHDTYFLVALIDNDYFESHISEFFDEVMETFTAASTPREALDGITI